MIRIIKNKKYDTSSADEILESSNGRTDFNYEKETLYRKKSGEYFLSCSGGPLSKYSQTVSSGCCRGSAFIVPIDEQTAKCFVSTYSDKPNFVEVFGTENGYDEHADFDSRYDFDVPSFDFDIDFDADENELESVWENWYSEVMRNAEGYFFLKNTHAKDDDGIEAISKNELREFLLKEEEDEDSINSILSRSEVADDEKGEINKIMVEDMTEVFGTDNGYQCSDYRYRYDAIYRDKDGCYYVEEYRESYHKSLIVDVSEYDVKKFISVYGSVGDYEKEFGVVDE